MKEGSMKFNTLAVDQRILDAVARMGFAEMTAIQAQAIPRLLAGKDIIGRSQTGTGKTLAFAIPAVQKVDPAAKRPQVLILLPTRELALQVAGEFEKLLTCSEGVAIAAVFGGASMPKQIRAFKSGAQIVVGTPGRIMDHLRRGTLRFDAMRMVVLDEADEMLDMGFREDIEAILDRVDHPVQTALFSATMPAPITKMAELYQRDPETVAIAPKNMVAAGIEERYYSIVDGQKFEALTRLLAVYRPRRALIFCNTKKYVDELTNALQDRGYSADKIHGDMRQEARLAVLRRFAEGRLAILVATDVAARGIDVDDVDIVFNYDVPDNEEYYVHRIGRTGRAGKSGLSLTLARRRDQYRLKKITRYTRKPIEPAAIALRLDAFKDRFGEWTDDDSDMPRYLQAVDELAAQGFEMRYVAAVLLRAHLPFRHDDRDINLMLTGEKGTGKGIRRKRRTHFDPAETTKIFIGVGKKDGAKKRDVLGAICGESGIASDAVGEIAMYGHFTYAAVDSALAGKVVRKLNGAAIAGKRVAVEIAGQKLGGKRRRKGAKRRH
ncbi:DEAD/DEAH box helicase [Pseudoramibacter alactolyticus ATCC 23263]|uniref:RNA helicase n=2 Tax=Pseudoramibacter TaxID=113286 RepID=E6MGT8_9FIRM|nr:DEAD/DEAH box helicase [Pseudoramibacter alactolyticus ATCC 23263]